MSTRVEAPPIGGSFAGPILIAIIVAFVVGALMGTVVTTVVNDSLAASSGVAPARPLVVTPVGTPSWDSQKLEAMEGRALAEQYRGEQAVAWDVGKLEEMKGHQLAEQSRTEAMEDRQLAEDVHRPRPVGGPLG
jgi:cell division protein FtsN